MYIYVYKYKYIYSELVAALLGLYPTELGLALNPLTLNP